MKIVGQVIACPINWPLWEVSVGRRQNPITTHKRLAKGSFVCFFFALSLNMMLNSRLADLKRLNAIVAVMQL